MKSPPASAAGQRKKRGNLARVLCSLYKRLVWQPGVQAFFLVSLAGGLGFLAYSTTRLQVDTQPVRYAHHRLVHCKPRCGLMSLRLYVKSHPMGRSLEMRKTQFREPEQTGLKHFQVYNEDPSERASDIS